MSNAESTVVKTPKLAQLEKKVNQIERKRDIRASKEASRQKFIRTEIDRILAPLDSLITEREFTVLWDISKRDDDLTYKDLKIWHKKLKKLAQSGHAKVADLKSDLQGAVHQADALHDKIKSGRFKHLLVHAFKRVTDAVIASPTIAAGAAIGASIATGLSITALSPYVPLVLLTAAIGSVSYLGIYHFAKNGYKPLTVGARIGFFSKWQTDTKTNAVYEVGAIEGKEHAAQLGGLSGSQIAALATGATTFGLAKTEWAKPKAAEIATYIMTNTADTLNYIGNLSTSALLTGSLKGAVAAGVLYYAYEKRQDFSNF